MTMPCMQWYLCQQCSVVDPCTRDTHAATFTELETAPGGVGERDLLKAAVGFEHAQGRPLGLLFLICMRGRIGLPSEQRPHGALEAAQTTCGVSYSTHLLSSCT